MCGCFASCGCSLESVCRFLLKSLNQSFEVRNRVSDLTIELFSQAFSGWSLNSKSAHYKVGLDPVHLQFSQDAAEPFLAAGVVGFRTDSDSGLFMRAL